MSKRALELEIMKGSAPVDTIDAEADPGDVGTLRDALTGWLEAEGWKKPTWGQFWMRVRYQDEFKVRRTIRAQ